MYNFSNDLENQNTGRIIEEMIQEKYKTGRRNEGGLENSNMPWGTIGLKNVHYNSDPPSYNDVYPTENSRYQNHCFDQNKNFKEFENKIKRNVKGVYDQVLCRPVYIPNYHGIGTCNNCYLKNRSKNVCYGYQCAKRAIDNFMKDKFGYKYVDNNKYMNPHYVRPSSKITNPIDRNTVNLLISTQSEYPLCFQRSLDPIVNRIIFLVITNFLDGQFSGLGRFEDLKKILPIYLVSGYIILRRYLKYKENIHMLLKIFYTCCWISAKTLQDEHVSCNDLLPNFIINYKEVNNLETHILFKIGFNLEITIEEIKEILH